MSLGNTQLVRHGIETEKTDLRFHVSIAARTVYVFEPKNALIAINTGQYREALAYTGNIVTARGYLIPPSDIKGCHFVPIPDDIFYQADFIKTDSTPIKGKKAETVVKQMIRAGLISLVMDIIDADDKELQIDGDDLISIMATNYQVKCDWNAGPRENGGTGNLYIQVAECNPLKQY